MAKEKLKMRTAFPSEMMFKVYPAVALDAFIKGTSPSGRIGKVI